MGRGRGETDANAGKWEGTGRNLPALFTVTSPVPGRCLGQSGRAANMCSTDGMNSQHVSSGIVFVPGDVLRYLTGRQRRPTDVVN